MSVFGLRTVQFGEGMFWAGGVLGSLNVFGMGEDEVERKDPGAEADFLVSSSFLKNSNSFSNLALSGLKQLVLESERMDLAGV